MMKVEARHLLLGAAAALKVKRPINSQAEHSLYNMQTTCWDTRAAVTRKHPQRRTPTRELTQAFCMVGFLG